MLYWIKSGWLRHEFRREVVNGCRNIRNAELREHQYRDGYEKCLEDRRVEWNEERNVELMWEQVKRAVVEGVREFCVSVIVW